MKYCKKHKQEYYDFLSECPICFGEQAIAAEIEYKGVLMEVKEYKPEDYYYFLKWILPRQTISRVGKYTVMLYYTNPNTGDRIYKQVFYPSEFGWEEIEEYKKEKNKTDIMRKLIERFDQLVRYNNPFPIILNKPITLDYYFDQEKSTKRKARRLDGKKKSVIKNKGKQKNSRKNIKGKRRPKELRNTKSRRTL